MIPQLQFVKKDNANPVWSTKEHVSIKDWPVMLRQENVKPEKCVEVASVPYCPILLSAKVEPV